MLKGHLVYVERNGYDHLRFNVEKVGDGERQEYRKYDLHLNASFLFFFQPFEVSFVKTYKGLNKISCTHGIIYL